MSLTDTETRQLLPREERRASILDAAARAFAHAGFAATSMDDVATEAGVTKLILYRHFESKAELYRAVLESVTSRLQAEFVTQMEEHRHGFTTRALLTVARQDPDAVTLLLVHARREPEFAEYADEHRRHAVDVANTLLGDTISDPHMKAWAAETLVHYLMSGVLAWLEHGDPDRDEEFVDLATQGLVALYTSWVSALGT